MNIAKLNTASLDDKTYIIKRGTSGGATINNQNKVVDITENGTTEVVADGGYTGLGKVTINTEVSGGGNASTIEYEYYALSDGWGIDLGFTFPLLSTVVKIQTSTLGMVIAPTECAKIMNNGADIDPVAIAIDMSLIISVGGQQITAKESILSSGTTEESLAKYRITKEQFYSLD